MVEVTTSNFDAVHEVIKALLPKSCFVSIDLELTGLVDPRCKERNQPDDLPSQRYMKLREGIKQFAMIQFGICIFQFDASSSKLTAHPFNIWTLPQHNRNSPFLVDSSSLRFLREHGFDFNHWIDEGIGFMSSECERREREHHQVIQQRNRQRRKQNQSRKERVSPRTAADIELFQRMECKIKAFADDEKEEILQLEETSSFMRLLIYQLIEEKYKNQLMAFKVTDPEASKHHKRHLAIKRVTAESADRIKSEKDRKKEKEWNERMNRKIGVRHIFDLLVEHRIPVIFHNALLDAMHLYSSFIGNLPNDPCVFTKRLHDKLPFILDTKYMMPLMFKKSRIGDHYSLTECFRFFRDQKGVSGRGEKSKDDDEEHGDDDDEKCLLENVVEMEVCIRSESDGQRDVRKEDEFMFSKNGKFHQAGYDAFCTGFVFAKCGAYLHVKRGGTKDKNTNLWNTNPEAHCDDGDVDEMRTLGHFVNRIHFPFADCKYFYVGNQYMIDGDFNLNLNFESALQSGGTANSKQRWTRKLFCGCDYKAIEPRWHQTFYVEQQGGTKEIRDAVKDFLKDYSPKENITVVVMRGYNGGMAQVRIDGVVQLQFEEMLKVIQSKQPRSLRFHSFIDHKSRELQQQYRELYGSIQSFNVGKETFHPQMATKKRSLKPVINGSASEMIGLCAEPPSKKQRTH